MLNLLARMERTMITNKNLYSIRNIYSPISIVEFKGNRL